MIAAVNIIKLNSAFDDTFDKSPSV
jgi:hypothetical protein